jgi:hypothetical protein
LENGQVEEAVNRLLKYHSSPFTAASIAFEHREQLSTLYLRIAPTKELGTTVIEFILAILPYVLMTVPGKALLQLMDLLVTSSRFRRLDQVLWAISCSSVAQVCDEPVYDRLLSVPPDDRLRLFANPFSTIQHCQRGQMFRTAAWIAHIFGLHEEAVVTATKVGRDLTTRYIRRAPRSMRAALCKQVDIEIDREEGQEAIRLASKAVVVAELRTIVGELKNLEEQSHESVRFLRELEEWGQAEARQEPDCGYCRKKLAGSTGYRFSCGHAFHMSCLLDMAVSRVDRDTLARLNRIRDRPSPSKDDLKLQEQILASDCPICGMLAAETVREPVIDFTAPKWDLVLDSEPRSPRR